MLDLDVPISARDLLDIGAPPAAVSPEDGAAVARTLREAGSVGAAVVPWGGGTEQALGAPPRRCDLVLATDRLRGIDFYTPEDLTIGVRGGTTLATIAETLRARGQFLPIEVPHPGRVSAAGLVATAASGLRRQSSGGVRDLVIGLEVALADGSLCRMGGRVVKNVAGYDLNKLFTGSLGTLGVIVGVNFKVQPVPRHRSSIVCACPSLESACEAGSGAARSNLGFGAVLVDSHGPTVRLVILAEGMRALVLRQEQFAVALLRERGLEPAVERGADVAEHLGERLLARRAYEGRSGEVLLRGSVPSTRLGTAMGSILAALSGTYVLGGAQLDLALGTFYLSLVPGLVDSASPDRESSSIAAARAVAQRLGGALVIAGAAPAVRRAVDPWGAPAAGASLARALKRQLDPGDVLNPGRFAYGI